MFKCLDCGYTQKGRFLACPECGGGNIEREIGAPRRSIPDEVPQSKPHRHSYRKNGVCACGAVVKTRQAK